MTSVHVGCINTVVGYWKMQTRRSLYVTNALSFCNDVVANLATWTSSINNLIFDYVAFFNPYNYIRFINMYTCS